MNFCLSPGRTFLQEGWLERRHQAQGAGWKLKGKRVWNQGPSWGCGWITYVFQFSIIIQCPPAPQKTYKRSVGQPEECKLGVALLQPVAGNETHNNCTHPAEFFPFRTPLGLALWKTMETATLRSLGSGSFPVRPRCSKRMPSVFSRKCSSHTYSDLKMSSLLKSMLSFHCPLWLPSVL